MTDIIEAQQSTSDDSNCFEEMIRKETTLYLERAWEAYRRLVRRAAGVELMLEAEPRTVVACTNNDEANGQPEVVLQ